MTDFLKKSIKKYVNLFAVVVQFGTYNLFNKLQ
jgi:hypothetical protein